MRPRSKKSVPVLELTLTFFSILLTLVSVELVYRVYLSVGVSQKTDDYLVFDDWITEYNREFGYSYVANRSFIRVYVKNGYPVMCNEITINELGNIDKIIGVYEEADLKILVFGVSFTANTYHNGPTWPDLLQDKLGASLSKKVNVVNFGRDAYGVLQMFDLASVKVEQFKPDLVVVAFITDDLSRARIWNTVKYINGEKRAFTLMEPSEKVDPRTSPELAMLNPLVTKEWCESMLASPKEDDPLLEKLNDQFRRLKKEKDPVDFTSLSTSFLFNKIVHGNPFHNLTKLSRIPLHTLHSFDMDSRFVENVASLNRSNIPYYLVHLPRYEELKAKRYILNDKQEALLQSLQELTGQEVISLMEYYDTSSTDNLENLFAFPYDAHPSLRGLEFYAEATSEALINRIVNYAHCP
jgi:lysophospholipase L1-like esterase